MYYIKKSFEISASHHLKLSYQSKCSNVHGHNWHITIYCKSRELNKDGMVADFSEVKRLIHDRLDHADTEQIPTCYKAEVQESEGNVAIYEEDL